MICPLVKDVELNDGFDILVSYPCLELGEFIVVCVVSIDV